MRLFEFKQKLFEGGNIWKGDLTTDRIPKDLVIPTVNFLEKITGLQLQNNMLGSTGLKDTSGDIDLAVDPHDITKEELITRLQNWANKNDKNALIKKTGINVHFRCPIAGRQQQGYIQVDFMFINDISFTKWSMRGDESSKYPGRIRNMLLRSIAKSLNLRYSMTVGLVNRINSKLLPKGNNPDVIAKILLNPKASAKDLSNTESILNALKNDPKANEKLKDAREELKNEGQLYNL